MLTFKEAYYMGKHRSAAWHADGGANDEGWDREHRSSHNKPADHPHSVHINGKKWKTFGSHSHATNVARKIKGATVHKEEVQLDELSDKTLMSYAQKVHDDSQKHDKDPTKRSAEKRNKSVMGFSRAINKLESRPHKESTDMCGVCGQTPCNCTHISEESGAYEKSEENKRSADAAKKQGDMFAHHLHMADHHDNLAQWHSEKGRHSVADTHAKKSEEHHEKAMALKESAQLNELSSELLDRYKKKAGLAAQAADKAKKYDLGHKRFKGIIKATFKQFANDAKK